jgi:hypothetical protein
MVWHTSFRNRGAYPGNSSFVLVVVVVVVVVIADDTMIQIG